MVCIYCSGKTQVINSRHQKRVNHIWRRRVCMGCDSVFTTTEAPDLTQALVVAKAGNLEPFQRDKLFTSLHGSLRHRKSATADATALTATVIAALLAAAQNATIGQNNIVRLSHATLQRFDQAAASHYAAFHP